MSTPSFFRATAWPQSTALRRIANWREFAHPEPHAARQELQAALQAEQATRNPRRKVVAALQTAISETEKL